jgi:hypothetical protein
MSRSMLSGRTTAYKSIINPVGEGSMMPLQFNPGLLKILYRIENNYVEKMAQRKYLEIPDSLPDYLFLNDSMLKAISQERNTNLKLLFQTVRDGLDGAINSKISYIQHVECELQILGLNKTIEDILSGKNEINAFGDVCGGVSINRMVRLKPLYSNYIYLYGMPAFGVGFDPAKLSLIATILQKNGIDPYA